MAGRGPADSAELSAAPGGGFDALAGARPGTGDGQRQRRPPVGAASAAGGVRWHAARRADPWPNRLPGQQLHPDSKGFAYDHRRLPHG